MNREAANTDSIRSPVGVVGFVLAFVQLWSLRYMFGKGLLIAVIGLSWILQPSQGRLAGIEWMDVIEPWMVGSVWIAAGLWAAVASRTRSAKAQRVGWFGLIAVPAVTALYFTVAWVIFLLPVAAPGAERGWITAASYGAFAMAYCVSRIQTETREIDRAWGDE